ncbi:MAG: phasin family protein [Pseudanabaenaceae cyanobacterium]|jgi:polyhydroxyalkanoate synthesis regulator phasin
MDNASLLKQLLLLGVGTTSLMAERLKEAADEWVKEGKIDPDQATDFINDFTNRIKSEQGNVEQLIQRQIRNVLQDIGVPRQNEVDELRGRIDRLERQVRELENKLWKM